MTKKLYDLDSHLKYFDAKIIQCEPADNGLFKVILDQTAFFPEGGGQKPDIGTIGDIDVVDVQEVNGDIIHYVKHPLQEGKLYTGIINWDIRFSRMQNHSGEHIVSGIVHDLYGYDNVGFHMSDEVITIDFNGVLTDEQLIDIELKANQAIWSDVEITAWYPDKDELQSLDFRSKKEIVGETRLVRIGDIDLCACCAPHVSHTGEIGQIKIISSMSHRGGIRIEMIAGDLAYNYSRHDFDQVKNVSQLLSVKHSDILSGIDHLTSLVDELKQEKYNLCVSLTEYLCNKYSGTSEGNVCEFNTVLPDSMCREFVNKTCDKTNGIVAIFTGTDDCGYKYTIGSKSVDLRELAATINSAINGKGGGSSSMIQGTVNNTKNEIENYIMNI